MDLIIQGVFRGSSVEKVGENKDKDLFKIHIEQLDKNNLPRLGVIKSFSPVDGKFKVGDKYNFACYESLNVWKNRRTDESRARVDFMLKDDKK